MVSNQWAERPQDCFAFASGCEPGLVQPQVYESMEDDGSPPPASPLTPGRVPENASLSSVQSNFDVDALFRISM